MPRLIWVFAGRTLILLVLSCRGSITVATFCTESLVFDQTQQYLFVRMEKQNNLDLLKHIRHTISLSVYNKMEETECFATASKLFDRIWQRIKEKKNKKHAVVYILRFIPFQCILLKISRYMAMIWNQYKRIPHPASDIKRDRKWGTQTDGIKHHTTQTWGRFRVLRQEVLSTNYFEVDLIQRTLWDVLPN